MIRRLRALSFRALSLRARVGLLTATAVALAVVLTSLVSTAVYSRLLRGEIDQTLITQARSLGDDQDRRPGDARDMRVLEALGMTVTIVRDGTVIAPPGAPSGTGDVDAATVARVQAPGGPPYLLGDAGSGAGHRRVITLRARDGSVIVMTRSLVQLDRAEARFGSFVVVAGLAAVLLAGGAGIAVAGAGLSPVRRLTRAAARVARTQELDTRPIEVTGSDETAQLAASFNAMLAALNRSRERQRRLVADAGHELRTPLTSLRTNIDLLVQMRAHPERTPPHGGVDALLADVRAQLRELTALVGDLVELARDDEPAHRRTRLRFDQVVREAAERARPRAAGQVTIECDLRPWTVHGAATELSRAVTNLLDNAIKFSPPGGTVRVVLRDGRLTVSDRGPGIAEADLPHVFERFYRSAAARSMPGSGLGLAIVRHTAEQHGGTVRARNRPGGGAVLCMHLPGSPVPPDPGGGGAGPSPDLPS
ncbi:HAMP domain-containing sensor histidine kinase [Actinomadura miaoliensis]|uniref:histidine kinase n=1 Tax=Actinomadura miaoliensis TaxID=430685 RepID=A0ABP7VQB1_9ACTN